MSRRILIITQSVGTSARLLEFFSSWIIEFARTHEHVTVLALEVSNHTFPSNVTVVSLGKERGVSRPMRWMLFVRELMRIVPRVDAVFAHMSPIFAIASWPWCVLLGKRLVLWYLHRSVTWRLRLAYAMCDVVVTADASSLRIRGPKVVAVGHGIDTSRGIQGTHQPRPHFSLRLVCVGRLSPIKRVHLFLEALAVLKSRGLPVEARIVGSAVMSSDHAYEAQLHRLVAKHGLGGTVEFMGYVAHNALDQHYTWADVVVGLTPPGGIDKVLLEAMSWGCSVVTTNTVMADHVGHYASTMVVAGDDPGSIAQAIASVPCGQAVAGDMQALAARHDVRGTVERISQFL
jgi:glycosyltransferase involved in cell wall biosynthesis